MILCGIFYKQNWTYKYYLSELPKVVLHVSPEVTVPFKNPVPILTPSDLNEILNLVYYYVNNRKTWSLTSKGKYAS